MSESSRESVTSAVEKLPVPGLPEDWHLQATRKIVSTVDQVKVKTSGPAIGIARSSVFGLMAVLLAMVAIPMLLIGLVRGLNDLLPWGVWLVYLVLGALFLAVGGFLWSKRPRRAAS